MTKMKMPPSLRRDFAVRPIEAENSIEAIKGLPMSRVSTPPYDFAPERIGGRGGRNLRRNHRYQRRTRPTSTCTKLDFG
jgi:hypothetical protein